MTRQLAIGVLIGFAVAVLILSLWERSAAVPEAPRPGPAIDLRPVPLDSLPRAHQGPFHLPPPAYPDGGR